MRPTHRQIAVFLIIGLAATVAQLLSSVVLDLCLRGLDSAVVIPFLGEQALGSFLAFLL